MRNLCLAALITLAPALLATERPQSNVLGEECPELLLEEVMVQGEIAPLENRVSFFLFYQRESEGCERIAMPRVQKLHEAYAGSKCWQVFVINTAFDKETYPYLGDVDETRKHLRRMEWTMPVARDLDELSNELFTLDEISGVPQAVVVDENGVVHAHDWYSTDEEMDRVDAVFKRLAAGMNCHCIRMPRKVRESCSRIYKNIEEGNYAKAWDGADTMCKNVGTDEPDRKDADYLKRFVEGIVEIRVERHRNGFNYDPESALAKKDAVLDDMKPFEGVPGAADFITEVSKWKDSPRLKDFLAARDELAKVEEEIESGVKDDVRADLADKLTAIAERAKDTVLSDRVNRSLEAIGAADRVEKPEARESGDSVSSADKGDSVKSSARRNDGEAPARAPGIGRKTGSSAKSGSAAESKPASGNSTGTGSESSRHRTVRSR